TIIRHTPASFKKYSSLLFLTAMNDTLCIFCDSVLIQRVLPTPVIIAQVWHGACSFISKDSCYTIFSVYLHTITTSIALMVVSFWYRHEVLHNSQPPRPLKLGIIIGVLYIPSFIQMVTLPLSTMSIADVKTDLEPFYPTLDYTHGPITGNPAHGNIYADYGTLFPMIFPIPSYAFILIVRYKILRVLRLSSSRMSERTKELHVQLVKTLTYHACLPIFTVIADSLFTIMLLDIYRHPLLENFVFFFASVPACLSPLLTLMLIRPYRSFITCEYRRTQQRLETNNSAMTVSNAHKKLSEDPTI
ncbi:hypothetical protein PMAYCL1PPCAC_21659, partial [Pristionchus mayeri]